MCTTLSFGERLKGLIVTRGLSQKDFAPKTGISQSTISKYISGKFEPTLYTAIQMAEVLGISLDSLAGRSSVSKETSLQEMCRRVRQKKGWTQYHLATALGTTQTEVSFIENGFIPPDVSKAQHIYDLYRGCCR